MDKRTVARTLDEIGRYIELSEANKFKVLAYERAARSVDALEEDIETVVAEGRLLSVAGIGKGIAPVITEIVQRGSSQYLDELRAQFPPGIFELMRVPGLGLKKIALLYSTLGIGSLDELETAGREGRLAALPGFGAKTQQKILEGIAEARHVETRQLLPGGIDVAEDLLGHLAEFEPIAHAEVSGSVRRKLEVVNNVNIAIAASDPERALLALRESGIVDEFEQLDAHTARGRNRNQVMAFFHVAKPDDFGAMLLQSTGSEAFVNALTSKLAANGYALENGALSRNGKHVAARTEDVLFEKAGVPFVEPELRESAALVTRKKRVTLIEPSDLRGTFHVHTTWSDGKNTLTEMLDAAHQRDFEYVGISDHSQTASYAGGLTEAQLVEQHAEIDSLRERFTPMRIFRGTEADILADGSIDYGAATLDRFDFVIASVHSKFTMPKDEMTARILRALDDPHVTFLGHLTGRLLLSRDGYTIDFEQVFDRAAERGVMIEINGSPRRLELDWRLLQRASSRGVRFSINPDAHSTGALSHVITGTWVARKGGLPAKEIFNTRPVEEIEQHFAKRMAAARLANH